MKTTISELQKIVIDYGAMLREISDDDYAKKPQPNKWSKKEILGHLIDSAQNNIRRFIVAQYESAPFILYNQDQWVAIANYQQMPPKDLIQLWNLLNKQICFILQNTSSEAAMRNCETSVGNLHSIEWLAGDYVKHLLHHLHQILEMEPVEYPVLNHD